MTEIVLAEADFNRKVRSYWLLSGTILLTITVFGILLLPFWLILGHYVTERYLENMSCTLTDRSLKVSRGVFVRRETTVPLDKITDLGMTEGPIMRMWDLQALRIETAGQSSPGSLVQLVGIVNAREFRDRVLRQRDEISGKLPSASTAAGPALSAGSTDEMLREIRDVLLRIESRLPAADEE